MYITLTPQIDIDNAEKEQTNKCHFCESKINLQATYYDNKIINACFLCHIVVNYQKEYIYHCVLCSTELTQLEVIKKTWDFFDKKGYVPRPNELDPDAKLVKIPAYIFANFTNKHKFSDYCLFFTNKVEDMLTDATDDVFGVSKKKVKIDILEYFDLQEYIISDIEKENANKEIEKIVEKNYEVMVEKENKLKKRFLRISSYSQKF
jgi:hypothetical protein